MQALSETTIDVSGILHEPRRSATPATTCERDFLAAAATRPGHWTYTPTRKAIAMTERHERATGYLYAFFGLSFIVGFLALVDWAAEGRTLEYALGVWNDFPPILRLTVICLSVGTLWMLGTLLWIIRSAEPVDEDECPINVKGKR